MARRMTFHVGEFAKMTGVNKRTLHYYDSTDGVCRTVFGGIDNQGHECREHTCEQAWQFMKDFSLPE